MGRMKRILAGLVSAVLLLGFSGGALGAGNIRFQEVTLGIYMTAGLSGIWWSQDPLTGVETPENYLSAVSDSWAGAEEKDASLFLDLGNTPEELDHPLDMGVEPMAAALRLGSFFLLPGTGEKALDPESRKSMEDVLSASEYPGRTVEIMQAEGEEPWLTYSLWFGNAVDELTVGILPLGRAEDLDEAALREERGWDVVIAAAPSGTWSGEELARLAAKTERVDLILVGSGEEPPPAVVRNGKGDTVPVAGGKGAFQIELTIGRNGALSIEPGKPLEKKGSKETLAELEKAMEPYRKKAEALAEQELAPLAGDWDGERDPFQGQSDTVTVLQEARLWVSGAELSLLPWGAVKEGTIGELAGGSLTLRSCYALYSEEVEELRVVEMTGLQLKNWMEKCAARLSVGRDGRIYGDAGTDQLYGLSYALYLGNPEGSRVMNMTCRGEPVTAHQTFRVVVDAARLTGTEKDEYGWYEATGIDLSSEKLLTGEESGEVWTLEISPAQLAAAYVRSLTAQWRQLTPLQARSRWSVTKATSEESLAPVSRMEFVSALYRAAGSPPVKRLGGLFSDVPRTGLELLVPTALDWAVETGVVQGNGGGLFLPDTPISREQASVMLLRFDVALGRGPAGSWATAVPYTDAANVAAWASEALMWNVLQEYLPPDDGGNFRPWAAVTAAELEALLEKLEQK